MEGGVVFGTAHRRPLISRLTGRVLASGRASMRLFGRANIDSEWAETTRCAWVGLGGCVFVLTLGQSLPSRPHLDKYGAAFSRRSSTDRRFHTLRRS